ncbi:MAG TPA: hypothetical protein VFS96_09650 [Nitrolancea sp.]|nr:hypothetical protein [Nitrolancea sp.]
METQGARKSGCGWVYLTLGRLFLVLVNDNFLVGGSQGEQAVIAPQ